jgi:two-component system nitrogen regulation sensor histidine kinase GlnL
VPRDLSGVLDAVLAGIVVLDPAGDVELVNAAGCRILGTSAETVLGLPVERLQGADHAVAKLARTVLDTGGSLVESEQPMRGHGESPLVVDVSAAPLFDAEDGSRSGVVLVLRDRTIENSLRAFVADRESLSAFGRIAAGIAHEVKNPLGGIRGAAEILSARASDAKSQDAAELIVREVERIAGLVDDLMVFTRGEDVQFAPLNIHRILDGVIDLLTLDPVGAGFTVQREFDPSLPEVMGDADRLTQVFHNLLRNALEAMEGGDGTVVIKTRMAFDPRVGTERDGSTPALLVEIADTGPGIEPDVLEKIATPFFTTRTGGTGLGLAVSRHWVARHGGSLRIVSQPGAGTQVRVSLPLRMPS